jgi:hypothetical protein
MKRMSYARSYYNNWADWEASWDRLIETDLAQRGWSRPSHVPQGCVSDELLHALACLYAGDRRRGEVFLRRAIRNADRLEAEDRVHDTAVAEAGYPLSLGELIRDRAYARWLLGEGLLRADLRRAGEHIATWCLTKAEDCERFQTTVTMCRHLQAVRCVLIAGDVACARKFLATRQPMRRHHAGERDLWRRLVHGLPDLPDEVRRDIEAFFDRVRDPDFHEGEGIDWTFIRRDWLALESGMIRQMYLINPSPMDPLEPDDVIKAVAY